MEKEIKWVISGTYDNPYAKYVLDEGLGKMNEMNKYQEALDRIEETYYNLDNCLSAMKRFGKDVQTLSELVDKETPKKWDEDYVLEQINCPVCGKYWNIIDNCTETFRYCPNCGQRLEWGGLV